MLRNIWVRRGDGGLLAGEPAADLHQHSVERAQQHHLGPAPGSFGQTRALATGVAHLGMAHSRALGVAPSRSEGVPVAQAFERYPSPPPVRSVRSDVGFAPLRRCVLDVAGSDAGVASAHPLVEQQCMSDR